MPANISTCNSLYRVTVEVGLHTYHINLRASSAELAINFAIADLEACGVKYSSIQKAKAEPAHEQQK